ncbi:hypothetical protein [Candidatus Similichlamydia laticola]|nr:hypothetical protein [Candidatus Similichlamydia laticola]
MLSESNGKNKGRKEVSCPAKRCVAETQKTLFLWQEFCKELSKARKRAAELCLKYGMTMEEFGLYIDNPSNFSPEEWQKIERHRQRTAACFAEIRGYQNRLRDALITEKPKEKLKKVKRFFGRREGWVQG